MLRREARTTTRTRTEAIGWISSGQAVTPGCLAVFAVMRSNQSLRGVWVGPLCPGCKRRVLGSCIPQRARDCTTQTEEVAFYCPGHYCCIIQCPSRNMEKGVEDFDFRVLEGRLRRVRAWVNT